MYLKRQSSPIILAFTILFSAVSIHCQATLNKGDIAFVGFNSDPGPVAGEDHSFSFIALTDIPGSEVIFFTEEGWNDDLNIWLGNVEGHIQWTAPVAGISCGTIIYITATSATTLAVTGGGTVVLAGGTNWNLLGGDQVLAYQGTGVEPAVPSFIAGINCDDGGAFPVDPVTLWNNPAHGPMGNAGSGLPLGLTNGTNCIALFIAQLTEQDNAKYTGTLTGTSTAVRASINNRANWSFDDLTPFNIRPGGYTTSVTCSGILPVQLVSFTASCNGDGVNISWATASETNNKHFIIESSIDGINFLAIATVAGQSNSSDIKTYQYTYKNTNTNNTYYRLKQTDFDGKNDYSKIINLHCGDKPVEFSFFPNPVVHGAFSIMMPETGVVSIMDIQGKLVQQQKHTAGKHTITLKQQPGMYFLQVVTKMKTTTYRLILAE